MNSGKKTTAIFVAIVAIVVIVLIVWAGKSDKGNSGNITDGQASTTVSVPVSETVKVSGNLSEYQNAELGFSIKYPNVWEMEEANSGVNFVIPLDKDQVSTVANLQANVQVSSGVCAFPPITNIKDRGTLKDGEFTFNTISISSSVRGRENYSRLYSLQTEGICYMFSFASITLPASSKNLTGSQATQAVNNNKAIIGSAETAFIEMIKSFSLVKAPQGKDETKVVPVK